jgi:tetratricopeptide (TPR) repeat protein
MSTPIAPFWRFVSGPRTGALLLGGLLLGAVSLGAVSLDALSLDAAGPRSSAQPAPPSVAPQLEPPALRALTEPEALCLASVPAAARLEPALARAQATVRSRPERPESWLMLGQAWLRQAQRSSDSGYALNADACAEQALSLAPEDAGALVLRARVRLDAHDFERARELLQSVLERNPEHAAALGTLSDAALELGDVPTATAAAQRLMDLDPGLPAYARASYLRWLHGQEQAAIELARLAIDAAGDPDERDTRAWTLVQAAQLFWQRGDYAGARAGYHMALAVRPSYAPALLGMGKVALSEADLGAAAEAFSRAFAAHPSVEAAALLGDALTQQGDVEAAAQSYARAEQLGRFDPRSLSYFYSTRDREPAAALELALRESRTRGDLYTEDALAWALYRNGRLAEAERHSARSLAFGTRDAQLSFHRGAILLALGQRSAGRALLARSLQQNPHFDLIGAAEARRLLGRSA